jgi:DNA mismatch repair ATPase MutL
VNGRWIQDVALVSALVQAYHTMLMVGRYPMAALFLELPAELVDVNVHPAKSEVRFRDKDRVFSGVQRAVKRALLAYTPVSSLDVQPRSCRSVLAAIGLFTNIFARLLGGLPSKISGLSAYPTN